MPTPISTQDLLSQLNWRYAVKKFDPSRKIPPHIWQSLEQALVLTPSSFGLQPWKFIIVNTPAVRQQLRAHSWNQTQITDASHMVVFAVKKDVDAVDVDHLINRIAQIRKVPEAALDGYKNIMVNFVKNPDKNFDVNLWSSRQVYIALGNFLTSAALLGVDACPMEGLDSSAYDQILGLGSDGYHTLCVAAAGYRANDDDSAHLAKVRYAQSDVIAYR